MAGTGIEVGLQELGSNLVTVIGIEIGLQEIRSKLVPGIEIKVGDRN